MSDFGLFEASLHDKEAEQRTAAADSLAAAVYDAREKFGEFLSGATDVRDFRDRIALCKDDLIKVIEPHIFPRTGVVRRVAKQLEREFTKSAAEVIDPEGDFHGYLDDVSGNDREKVDANVFVGEGTPHTGDPADTVFVTPRESSRRQAIFQTFPSEEAYQRHLEDERWADEARNAPPVAPPRFSDEDEAYLKGLGQNPDQAGGGFPDWDSYHRHHDKKSSRRQADSFGRPVSEPWADSWDHMEPSIQVPPGTDPAEALAKARQHRRDKEQAIEHFGSWCRAKNVRPSLNTLDRYASRGLPDRDYFAIVSAMQRGAAEHRLDEVGGSGRPAINPYTGDDSGAFKGNPEGHGHWDKDDRTPQSAYTDENGNAWAKGYTPDAEDVKARNRLKDPRSGELSPGESWGGPRHGARRTAAGVHELSTKAIVDALGRGEESPHYWDELEDRSDSGDPRAQEYLTQTYHHGGRRRTAAPDYLQKANDALTGLLNQEAETFQEQIAPMQQALTVVQQALAEQQQANPFNVMPGGAINVMPGADQGGGGLPSQSPPPGAPMDPSMMGGDPSMGGGAPPMDPSMMGAPPQDPSQQMMAARISRRMIESAMSRKHYQQVADAIRTLPEEHRGGISETLANMFKADNPRFDHAKFYAAAGHNPNKMASRRRRLASGQEVQWEGKACPDCVMAIANGDDSGAGPEWSWDKLDQHTQGIPGEGPLVVDDDEPWFGRGPCDTCGSPYDGDFHRVVRLGPRATRKRGGQGKA